MKWVRYKGQFYGRAEVCSLEHSYYEMFFPWGSSRMQFTRINDLQEALLLA